MDDYRFDPIIEKLDRDLQAAAILLRPWEVRAMVSRYYDCQEMRKGADNRVAAAGEAPSSLLDFIGRQQKLLETRLQQAMHAYVSHNPTGQWLNSITGIGPILSAGLIAHIDIAKAPTFGHIEKYAGLMPGQTWLGTEKARTLVKEKREEWKSFEGDEFLAMLHIAPHTSYQADRLLAVAKGKEEKITLTRWDSKTDEIKEFQTSRWIPALPEPYDEAAAAWKHPLLCAYPPPYDWEGLINFLARRPWNAELKTLLWKVSQSFVKFSFKPECFYGHMYRERKVIEWEKNENGFFRERAAQILAEKRIGKETTAYKEYSQGRFPEAHLLAMSARWAMKLFLSHAHEVMYWNHYHTVPPAPYAMAHKGHVGYIQVPNLHLIPDLLKAKLAAGQPEKGVK